MTVERTTNGGIEKIPSNGLGDIVTILNRSLLDAGALDAGAVTLPVGGTGSLTLVASDMRAAVVYLTGVLTGNRTLLWPITEAPRVVIFENNTTGAFTLTIKTTTGGSTGIEIKQGTRQLLYHNDTNVYPIGAPTTSTGLYIPSAHVYHNAAQSIANNTLVTLAFNSERDDNASMHDTVTNNSRLIAPIAGKYVISGNIEYAANAVGYRQLVFLKNGATNIGGILALPQTGATVTSPIAFTCQRRLAATDYVEIQANQNSGGALNVNSSAEYSPEFAMTWIAP